MGAQLPQKPEPVAKRHAQIENDRVGMTMFCLAQPCLCADRCAHLIPFESQHPRKGLRHALIVVDDEDFRCGSLGHHGRHSVIVTDHGSRISTGSKVELDKLHATLPGLIYLFIQSFGGVGVARFWCGRSVSNSSTTASSYSCKASFAGNTKQG